MIKYEHIKSEQGECIIKTNDDNSITIIPPNPANSDYQAYLKHLTENPTEGDE